MRSVAESVVVSSVFPATNKLRLLTNVSSFPVNWSQLTTLSEDHLFRDEFVGLASLQEIISNMVGTLQLASQLSYLKALITKPL
jgi:hypothetical protein